MEGDVLTKGFVTLATGEYYCWLAEHLYMSYKLFSGCDYPFYVITDDEGKDRLSKTFDGVIVEELNRNTVDKLRFFTTTPFDETVFIDADCSIVNDLNYIFEVFENNGSGISAIADIHDLPMITGESENLHGIQFSNVVLKKFGIKKDFPNFNGGVYYYKKSAISKSCLDFMLSDILPNYHYYGLLSNDEKTVMYDEPVVIVGMLRYGFSPVSVNSNIMVLVHDARTVKWDMKKHTCSFPWYEYTVSPSIIHWKFGGTETYTFEKYDADVRGKFYNSNKGSIITAKARCYVKYMIYPKLLRVIPSLHLIVARRKK